MQRIFKSNLFFLIILASLVFVVYGKSINYEFTKLDDDALTSKKSLYISNIKNFPKFFLTDCYHNKKNTQYYRPILALSFAVETIIFGVNTKIYHTVNIILFIFALYLIYLFLCKFCSNNRILKYIILLCSVHPIFVSTVVWIPARNDTLLAVFLFLFLITYLDYITKNKFIYFFLSIVFFVFALFTKETTVIIFPVMILLTYCFDLKITKKQVLNYLIFFIPILILYFYLRQSAVYPISVSHYIKHAYEYLLNIIYGTMLYIKYTFVVGDIPVMLYKLKFDILSVLINCVLFIVLIYIYILKIINRKIIVFSFVFFVLFMLPSFAQECYLWLPHRLIIPLISIIFIFNEMLDNLIIKYNILKKYLVYLFVILLVSFSSLSWLMADQYMNHKIYWLNAYNYAPMHPNVLEGLADVYIENKEYINAKNLVLEILKTSNNIKYYIKLSSIEYLINKDLDIAESNYLQCLNGTDSYFYKAEILTNLGRIYYLKNDLDKAIEYTKKSLELQPYDKNTLVYLANYYAIDKQFSKARPIYERLLKDNSKNEYYQYLIKTLEEDERENKIDLE